MNDSVLERYTRPPVAATEADDGEGVQDCGAFGFLRGIRDRAIMLELRRKDGSMRALGYAWLQAVESDPSGVISLMFPGSIIKLTGRNFHRPNAQGIGLLAGLLRHRVTFIQEADQVAFMNASAAEAVVERIEW
ncbi:hypothetical protein [Planctomyces sp. SH-PL14]|uniref:hypothetical protein n=1 Tax=Planctomyces sp. SH-PL14 TaxID=1632864 RepID=UPI00078E4AC9|nr:hypothetical protein [Planctomyces sp. SH-PL14]AMV22606.1 hypothetical protein VT03_32220 [Planctomyces sp. SH-PL14]